MSKHKKHKPLALNTARGEKAIHAQPVPPDGTAPADAPLPPQDAEVLHHVLPSRQGLAADLLRGSVPGSMERLAPDAVVSDVEGWVESDATVERLAHWHRESPDG